MFKFNNGNGATVCDCCGTLISTGFNKDKGPHFCNKCLNSNQHLNIENEPSTKKLI